MGPHATGFGKFPIQFIPNLGQTDEAVAFYLEGRDRTIYFTAGGLTFALAARGLEAGGPSSVGRWVVKLDFVDANKGVLPAGLERSGTVISYFKGKPEDWKAGLAACSKIIYRDLWPGIDVIYSGALDRMKHEFVIHPGADPSLIRLAYRGAESVALAADGGLLVSTPACGFEDEAPVAYQEVGGARRAVHAAFDLDAGSYGFTLGPHDSGQTLVIDPSSLVYCGFIGGEGSDQAAGIAVDGSGSATIVGYTDSNEISFPAMAGPDLAYGGGADDAFVAKVRPDGTGLVYCGYIGGADSDRGLAVAVDGAGNAYITGRTLSDGTTFPVTIGSGLATAGFPDAFVAKVDASGTALAYCRCLGGSSFDLGTGIAVDGGGSAYICGYTGSDETTFPVTLGPDLTYNGGPADAFVAKLDPSGASLAYCGYIGGLDEDAGNVIAVDGSGAALVSGITLSSERFGFPVTVGPGLIFDGSDFNAFAAKVDPAGAALDYCGYIHGAGSAVTGIAVDDLGTAYIAGYYDTVYWAKESFISRVSPSGSAFLRSNFIEGNQDDCLTGIAVDAAGSVYLAGSTNSSMFSLPETVGPGLWRSGDENDVFVAKLDSSLTYWAYFGFIAGHSEDRGAGIAIDGAGNAYVTGMTAYGEWSAFPAFEGPDMTYNGGDADVFVAKVPPVPAVSDPVMTSFQPTSAVANHQELPIEVEGSDFVKGAKVVLWGGAHPTTYVSDTKLTTRASATDMADGGTTWVLVRNPDGEISNFMVLTVNNPVPSLASLSPATAVAGGVAVTFQLSGSNFVYGSIVRWNGAARTSILRSPSILESTITASELRTGGEYQVFVENPAPEGGVSSPLVFRIATFVLNPATASATVSPGGTATYAIRLIPQYGSFDAPISLSCTGLPEACSASFSPAETIPGAAAVDVLLTLRTSAPSAPAAAGSVGPAGILPYALGLLLAAGALVFLPRPLFPSRGMKARRWLPAGAMAVLVLLAGSCGAGGDVNPPPPNGGTPAGTYHLDVKAISGTLEVTAPLTLIVR